MELRHRMIEVNHLRMRVAEQGTGPTVLLWTIRRTAFSIA